MRSLLLLGILSIYMSFGLNMAQGQVLPKIFNKNTQTDTVSAAKKTFDIKEFKEGLPCEWCNRPTKSILSLLYHCNKCGFEKEEWFPKNKEKEDPQYCDYCNP
jgi:Zn finger protein HypA/HybF involved in hydrogenase expression